MWLLAKAYSLVGFLNVFNNVAIKVAYLPCRDVANENNVVLRYDFPDNQIKVANVLASNQFPSDFLFGVMTSAYSTEGAWNVSGKTESDWDHMTHLYPHLIFDRSNADDAAQSFYKYKEDIQLAKSIGSKVYRISLSWSRLLPHGYGNYVNIKGLVHYINVIDEIRLQQMTPMVVLFDKEMPYKLVQLGGFTNPLMIDPFVRYAKLVFQVFGDKVKYWITFNEPNVLCRWSYGGNVIPSLNLSGIADYICGHNILNAHARIYSMYQRDFYSQQKGKVGIAIRFAWFEPKNKTSQADISAASRAYEWHNNWLVHPIFSPSGDYPRIMKQRINYLSFLQNFRFSRLLSFDPDEVDFIRGSADFLGINYYRTLFVSDFNDDTANISFENDAGISTSSDYPEDFPPENAPKGFGLLLRRLRDEYDPSEVFITENGYTDNGTDTNDPGRVVYHSKYMREALKAIQRGLNVRGYLAASLIDGFHGSFGYAMKSGLFRVDFNDDFRPRSPKLSARMIAAIYQTFKIPKIAEVFGETFDEIFGLDYRTPC